MKRPINILAVAIITFAVNLSIFAAPSIDGLLNTQVNASPLSLTPVIITFDHKPSSGDFLMLRSLGITGGRYMAQLPIVLTSINRTQFNVLKTKSGIRSMYANRTFNLFDREGRTITEICIFGHSFT